jgi:methyl-accepting chemotaxis protein
VKSFIGLKLRKKLMIAMMSVLIIALIIGVAGIIFIEEINTSNKSLHEKSFEPMLCIAIMYDNLAQQRIAAIDIVAYYGHNDAFINEEVQSISEKNELFCEALEEYLQMPVIKEEIALVKEVERLYKDSFIGTTSEIIALKDSDDVTAKLATIKRLDNIGFEISGVLDTLSDVNEDQAALLMADNQRIVLNSVIILAAILFFALIVSILFSRQLSKIIQRPVAGMERVMRYVNATGNIRVPDDMKKYVDTHLGYSDEISSLAASFKIMMDDILKKVETLEHVARGDLSTTVGLAGEEDILGIAVNDVIKNLSVIVNDVRMATDQLNSGTTQLAAGAQSIAMSSSQQSAAVDQLHSSAKEIAAEAEENARRAAEASSLTAEISRSASDGSIHMNNMALAMNGITEASHSVKSVMNVIDEIAFQTNILSLNAAVEAARAGMHGRGFAVVADEVRELATKSSTAASDSNTLINDTIVKADQGTVTVTEAIAFFRTIEDGITSTSRLLEEIATAAGQQQYAIEAINASIAELTKVVYHNSATSQQSAAASEEMSSQTLLLTELVGRFKLS